MSFREAVLSWIAAVLLGDYNRSRQSVEPELEACPARSAPHFHETMESRMRLLPVLMLIFVNLFPVAQRLQAEDAENIMESYINFLSQEDYKAAEQLWHPQYIETCHRLGITYRDTPYKYDCVSPLLENIDLIRNGAATWDAISTILDPQHQKVILKVSTPENTVSCEYFFMNDSSGTYMIPRFWMYLNNLSLVKTNYFDVYYRSVSQLNDYSVFDLDRFVETVAATFGTPPKKLLSLSQDRMEYFLVESESEVAELLGFPSQGAYYTPCDVIISHRLPDYHEVAMFMINYTQEDLGLYTEPFITRGLVCYLGGRFGQTSDVMWQIANFTLANDIFALDDILTFDGFHQTVGNIDFSFPLSLGLVSTLIDKTGVNGTLAILNDFSGSIAYINTLSTADVKSVLETKTNSNWDDIEKLVRSKIAADPFPNLKPGTASDSGLVVFESGTSTFNIRVTLDDEWYNFAVRPFSKDVMPEGVLTLAGSTGNQMTSYKSFLWAEQFPEREYASEIFAIRFNGQEIGVYDYLTNQLVAKYVSSFDENSALLEDGRIGFRFRESILRDRLDRYLCRLEASGL